MKKLRFIISVLILSCLIYFFSFAKQSDDTLSESFQRMIYSNDDFTKLTAIVLIADLNDTHIQQTLVNILPHAESVERTAIIYSLYKHNSKIEMEFIDSIPTDEQGIKKLLLLESPQGSYFRAPYLRIIKSIGDIAIYSDIALNKLKIIYMYSDGWQGDSILEMIMAAEIRRGNNTDLLLESLLIK